MFRTTVTGPLVRTRLFVRTLAGNFEILKTTDWTRPWSHHVVNVPAEFPYLKNYGMLDVVIS
jgi:hypothetical protein